MTTHEPTAEPMSTEANATTLPWPEVPARLPDAGTCWLATSGPDNQPHVIPIGAVCWEGTFYFTSGQGTRKRANLAANPHCALSYSSRNFDLTIEGDAALTRDPAKIRALAQVYRDQGWPATAGDGALDAPYSAPTTGPAPYDIYEFTPTRAFALGTTEETVTQCTRYRF